MSFQTNRDVESLKRPTIMKTRDNLEEGMETRSATRIPEEICSQFHQRYTRAFS